VTWIQLEPSAHAPCTSTIAGLTVHLSLDADVRAPAAEPRAATSAAAMSGMGKMRFMATLDE
jgi:hypothetical protein